MSTRVGIFQNSARVGERDAFHVPAVLVLSDIQMLAGSSVRFTDATCTKVVPSMRADRHAVIDPFLHGSMIPCGSAFWVFPVPELVESFVHQFSISLPIDDELTTEPEQPVRGGEIDDEDYEYDEDDACDGCYS